MTLAALTSSTEKYIGNFVKQNERTGMITVDVYQEIQTQWLIKELNLGKS
jgi:hypothetical protein